MQTAQEASASWVCQEDYYPENNPLFLLNTSLQLILLSDVPSAGIISLIKIHVKKKEENFVRGLEKTHAWQMDNLENFYAMKNLIFFYTLVNFCSLIIKVSLMVVTYKYCLLSKPPQILNLVLETVQCWNHPQQPVWIRLKKWWHLPVQSFSSILHLQPPHKSPCHVLGNSPKVSIFKHKNIQVIFSRAFILVFTL